MIELKETTVATNDVEKIVEQLEKDGNEQDVFEYLLYKRVLDKEARQAAIFYAKDFEDAEDKIEDIAKSIAMELVYGYEDEEETSRWLDLIWEDCSIGEIICNCGLLEKALEENGLKPFEE